MIAPVDMRRHLPIALIVALAPTAALVALLASPAFAYHDTLGGGASIAGGAFLSAFIVAMWRTFWEIRGLQCQGKS